MSRTSVHHAWRVLHGSLTLACVGLALPLCAMATHSHVGSSPFPPPDQEDTRFIRDVSPGLDRGCTYRDFGPRIIQVGITRYVGMVDGNGNLQNAQQLRDNGVVSAKATIRLPAFDIDEHANPPGLAPEQDRITFNGHDLGFLSGDNNVWKLNEFEVPIEWVKFPARGADGALPSETLNEVRIDIDVGNAASGQFVWCMDVDWVEIEFQAMAPLLLVHGTAAQSDSWDGAVVNRLENQRIPYSRAINMPQGGNGTIDGNAQFLRGRVEALAKSFGAKKIHLVCHSKGGLDSRRFLGTHAGGLDVEILSLYTIDTPHGGTVVSDLAVARRNLNDPHTVDPVIQDFWNADRLAGIVDIFLNLPHDPALSEQTVAHMADFNDDNPYTSSALFYNFAADADLNGNRHIEAAEASPTIRVFSERIGSLMYRVLGTMAGVSVVRRTNLWGLNEWHDVTAIPTTSFQENDLVVTTRSARHAAGSLLGGVQDANHSSIKNTEVTDMILTRIRADFPVRE
jgi:triacylglycerol lipase